MDGETVIHFDDNLTAFGVIFRTWQVVYNEQEDKGEEEKKRELYTSLDDLQNNAKSRNRPVLLTPYCTIFFY